MAPKLRFVCSGRDDALWEELDEATEEWDKSIRTSVMYRAVGDLILKYTPGDAEVMHVAAKGGHNIIYQLEYKDGSSVIVRIPIKENPTGLGPSIIMEYIEHNQNMSRELLDPTREAHERPMLDPETREDKHSLLYGQMTNTVLQLSSLKFPRIGSLADDGESISVMGRPLIVNMTDLVVHANTPQPTNLPPETHTYESAEELYTELADMHMTQPAFQKNDIADNDDMSKDQLKSRTSFRDIFTSTKLYNSAPLRDNPFLRKDASWLRMHVSDPPITVLTLHHDESAQGGSSANVGTKTYPDGFAHGRAVWPSTAIGPRGRRLFRTRSLAEERRDVILSEYWFVFQVDVFHGRVVYFEEDPWRNKIGSQFFRERESNASSGDS